MMMFDKGTYAGLADDVRPAAGAQGPFLMEVRDRMQKLHEILTDSTSTVAALRERLIGPWADAGAMVTVSQTMTGPGGAQPATEDVLRGLDVLLQVAIRGRSHVDAVNSAL